MIKFSTICLFLALCIPVFAQHYDAEVLYANTSIEVDRGSLIKNITYEIRINNRGGERFTQVEIPYSSLNKLSKIDAYIKDAGGRVVKKLKKSDLTTRSSISDFSLYEDESVQSFTLKHNTYPYTIVYSYQIKQSDFLYLTYWMPVIHQGVPTLAADLDVSVPIDYGLRFQQKQVDDFKVDTLGNCLTYHWRASYKELIKSEVLSPPMPELLPSVAIVPVDFNFERNGSFKDWASYGHWQFDLLRNLNELPAFEKERIQGMIQDVSDVKEQIKILYHYLQDETRYINVTIETGGLKPYPASYVAHNKYGDCKALTNYFKALLDFVQIPAYYAKVYAGSPNDEIEKEFPSQQFNHAILYVPHEEGDLWIDCTSKTPLNYIGTFIQNRDAFVVDDNKSHFLRIPALQPEDVLVSRNVAISYDPKEAHLSFESHLRGADYERILHLATGYNETDKARIVRNFVVPEGFHLVDYQIDKPDRDSASITMRYNVRSQQVYKHYGNDILLSNIAFALPAFEKPQYRSLPLQIDHPIYETDTLVYELPHGYSLNPGSKDVALSSRYGEYQLEILEDGQSIKVVKSLLINAGLYPKSEYAAFYDFYRQILTVENSTILSFQKNIPLL